MIFYSLQALHLNQLFFQLFVMVNWEAFEFSLKWDNTKIKHQNAMRFHSS